MPLLIKCSSPFAAPRHPHLKAPPHICCHGCRAHARPCLSTGWVLNRRFHLTFGTAAVLAQGGEGTLNGTNAKYDFLVACLVPKKDGLGAATITTNILSLCSLAAHCVVLPPAHG